jgi:putative acetyltransferase
MDIRETSALDLENILSVERAAFGHDTEAELVRELLNDPSAKPFLSLLAFQDDKAVGHILFTNARLTKTSNAVSISLLAPLAIVPDYQRQGIGGQLIKRGLKILSESGIALVFVLGHPEYYPRHGFQVAGCLGFEPTYPISDKHKEAWMVQALRSDVIGSVCGKVVCADALNKPEYWRE